MVGLGWLHALKLQPVPHVWGCPPACPLPQRRVPEGCCLLGGRGKCLVLLRLRLAASAAAGGGKIHAAAFFCYCYLLLLLLLLVVIATATCCCRLLLSVWFFCRCYSCCCLLAAAVPVLLAAVAACCFVLLAAMCCFLFGGILRFILLRGSPQQPALESGGPATVSAALVYCQVWCVNLQQRGEGSRLSVGTALPKKWCDC